MRVFSFYEKIYAPISRAFADPWPLLGRGRPTRDSPLHEIRERRPARHGPGNASCLIQRPCRRPDTPRSTASSATPVPLCAQAGTLARPYDRRTGRVGTALHAHPGATQVARGNISGGPCAEDLDRGLEQSALSIGTHFRHDDLPRVERQLIGIEWRTGRVGGHPHNKIQALALGSHTDDGMAQRAHTGRTVSAPSSPKRRRR